MQIVPENLLTLIYAMGWESQSTAKCRCFIPFVRAGRCSSLNATKVIVTKLCAYPKLMINLFMSFSYYLSVTGVVRNNDAVIVARIRLHKWKQGDAVQIYSECSWRYEVQVCEYDLLLE